MSVSVNSEIVEKAKKQKKVTSHQTIFLPVLFFTYFIIIF